MFSFSKREKTPKKANEHAAPLGPIQPTMEPLLTDNHIVKILELEEKLNEELF